MAAPFRTTSVKASVPFVFAIGLCLLLLTGQARGQDSVPDPEQSPSSSSALQFTIGPDFQLTPFHGSLLSWQHQLSRNRAYRIGISIGGSLGSSDGAGVGWSYRLSPDSTAHDSTGSTIKNDLDMKGLNLDLVSQYIWQHNHGRPIMFYGGIGPSIHYSRDRSQLSSVATHLTTGGRIEWQRRWQNESTWRLGAGISSTAGVEWRVAGQLSLLAEYRASVQYTYGKADAHRRTVRIRSGDGPRVSEDVDSEHSSPSFRNLTVGSQGAWLGISAYF